MLRLPGDPISPASPLSSALPPSGVSRAPSSPPAGIGGLGGAGVGWGLTGLYLSVFQTPDFRVHLPRLRGGPGAWAGAPLPHLSALKAPCPTCCPPTSPACPLSFAHWCLRSKADEKETVSHQPSKTWKPLALPESTLVMSL